VLLTSDVFSNVTRAEEAIDDGMIGARRPGGVEVDG
jgi:hypothetical protein